MGLPLAREQVDSGESQLSGPCLLRDKLWAAGKLSGMLIKAWAVYRLEKRV